MRWVTKPGRKPKAMNLGIVEVILSRSELVFLLNLLNAKRIIGIELNEFLLPDHQFNEILEAGKASLISRSLLDGNTLAVSPPLDSMIQILALRDIAIVLVRGIRGKGQQLFILNLFEGQLMEHTMPEDGLHRLAMFESERDFLTHLEKVVPLEPVQREGRQIYYTTQSNFEQIYSHIVSDKIEAISQLTKVGIPEELASAITTALSSPLYTLSMACFRIRNQKVFDTSSVFIFADEDIAWGTWSGDVVGGELNISLLPSGINDVKDAIKEWGDL